jgi:hypothetical protein
MFIIIKHSLYNSNIPTMILFSFLIAGDIVWNMTNKCYHFSGIFGSLVIGGGFGYLWGIVIDSIGKPNLLYLNAGSDQTVCSRPRNQLFKCTFSGKDGKTTTTTTTMPTTIPTTTIPTETPTDMTSTDTTPTE